MSTYLRGVNDYVGQIVPFKPNLQFHGSANQQLQSRYDTNKKALNNLYSSLLNADLTRDDNKASREEFFNLIGPQLQQISQLDLSQEDNVLQAKNVFQSIYNNKALVKDMVWTKNFKSEVERMEAIKNCTNPEQCGGQYWEEGEKYMLYKQQEFKNASAKDIFNFQDVTYIPYNSVADKALKYVKEADLNVTRDQVTGKYKITNKNGKLVEGAIYEMLSKTIGDNPQFVDMFKAKAYVDRKDWIRSKVSTGEYSNEQEAQVNYIKLKEERVRNGINDELEQINLTREQLDERIAEIENKREVTEQDKKEYEYLTQKRQGILGVEKFYSQFKDLDKNKNNNMALGVYGEILDQQEAALMLKQELQSASSIFSMRGAEQKIDEDQFALEEQKFRYDIALEQQKHANNKDLETFKKNIKIELADMGVSDGSDKTDRLGLTTDLETLQSEVATLQNEYQNLAKGEGSKDAYQEYVNEINSKNKSSAVKETALQYNDWLTDIRSKKLTEIKKKKNDVNEKRIKLGELPYYFDVVTPAQMKEWDAKTQNKFYDANPDYDNEKYEKIIDAFMNKEVYDDNGNAYNNLHNFNWALTKITLDEAEFDFEKNSFIFKEKNKKNN